MKKQYYLILVAMLCFTPVFGQQSKLQMKGDQFLQREKFDEAREYLQSLDDETKASDPLYNYYMGMVYYYTPELKIDALPYIENYLNEADSAQIEYYGHFHMYQLLAKMYHLKYRFDDAIPAYEKFINVVRTSPNVPDNGKTEIIKEAQRDIEHCKFAKVAVTNPRNVVIESLGDSINSKYPEYAAVVSQDEKQLIFTSRRPDTRGGKLAKEGGGFYEDIYAADLKTGSLFDHKNKKSDEVRGAFFNLVTEFEYGNFQQLSKEVNSTDHDGSIQLDKKDEVLYFYRDGNIWEINLNAEKEDEAEAKQLGVNVNSNYHEPSLFFSYDDSKLFIVSDRPGGYGGLDIYVSERLSDDEWSPAKNLGPDVNTEFDEDAPYFDPDGKTLYFSSKGHSSIGGFDIFRTTVKDTNWTKPVNIGFPVNTPADDIYFTMTSRYNRGYYASADLNGLGDMDLYRITFADERDPVAELVGLIKDGDKTFKAKSKIRIETLEGEEVIDEASNKDGDYFLLLGHGKRYRMIVETDGFAPYEREFDVPEQMEYFQLYQEVHHSHIKDENDSIIGQQITVFNAFGEPDTSIMMYDEETTASIQKIKEEQNIETGIRAYKELKFYFTADSLRKLMALDPNLNYDLDDETQVYFLKDNLADRFKFGSYELYEGSLKREDFLNEGDVSLNPDSLEIAPEIETPEGTVAAETIGGLFFTVQIGVYSRDVPHSVMFNLKPIVTKKTAENLFRYSTGTFDSVADATVRKDKIVQIGVTDAFVTAYYLGERITIAKAQELIEGGVVPNGTWEE